MNEFPKGFFWGTATAAHQVEGGNQANDWWAWEQIPGHIKNGDTSELACDHYRRFATDFDLLKSLDQNAHRLSLEWSRIEPRPGEFSAEALHHYREVLEALRARNIEPVVTMHHFTNPTWVADRGAWENPETADRFAAFAERVVDAYADLARYWVTINEPTVVAYQGYIRGEWPPGKRYELRRVARVILTLLRAHWLAYERVKARHPDLQLGVAHHIRIFDPARGWMPQDRVVAALFDRIFNRTTLKSLEQGRAVFPVTWAGRGRGPRPSQDFIGLNYYTRDLVKFNRRYSSELFGERVVIPGAPRSDLGWEIYPDGLYRTLVSLRSQRLPILVTENGVADGRDAMRSEYLLSHLTAVRRAIDDGARVGGYFYWTSMDNFEWAEGYSAKFGLVACDPVTQQRTVRASARLYAEICRLNALPATVELPPAPPTREQAAGPADLR